MKKITNDDTRDIAIRCVDSMFEHNLLDSKYCEQDDEFTIQDIIQNEINKALNIKEDDTCPKCDQYPYSEKENNCPVCFDAIGEHFDDAMCDVMNKYIKNGFTSENGDLFFDDGDIVKDFNYHIEGLLKLIKMTHKEEDDE